MTQYSKIEPRYEMKKNPNFWNNFWGASLIENATPTPSKFITPKKEDVEIEAGLYMAVECSDGEFETKALYKIVNVHKQEWEIVYLECNGNEMFKSDFSNNMEEWNNGIAEYKEFEEKCRKQFLHEFITEKFNIKKTTN